MALKRGSQANETLYLIGSRKPVELTPIQKRVIDECIGKARPSRIELAQRLGLDRYKMYSIIEELGRKGFDVDALIPKKISKKMKMSTDERVIKYVREKYPDPSRISEGDIAVDLNMTGFQVKSALRLLRLKGLIPKQD